MIQKKRKDVSVLFGIRLCLLRCQAGLTLAQLGKRLNLTAGALGMYEQGRRMPSLSTITEIADEFGVSCDFLLGGNGQNEREVKLELMAIMLEAFSQHKEESYPEKHNRKSIYVLKKLVKQVGA